MSSQEAATKSPGIEFYGGYQVYSDTGIDLTLLRENLKRTVTERIEKNCQFLPFLAALDETARANNPCLRDRPRIIMLDPSPILRQLAKEKVDYVVIGGIAMTARGCAHVTDDLDICYRRTPSNLAAIAAALAPLHPYLRGAPPGLPFRLDVPTLQAGLNFTLITDQGALDLLGEVSGVGTYDDVFAHSTEEDLYGL